MMTRNRKLASSRRPWDNLRMEFADFARSLKMLVDPYRPELHYMRGPGPKWHAKYARPAPADGAGLRGLARIKG